MASASLTTANQTQHAAEHKQYQVGRGQEPSPVDASSHYSCWRGANGAQARRLSSCCCWMKKKITALITLPLRHFTNAVRLSRMIVRTSIMPHHNTIHGRESNSIALRAHPMRKALAVGSVEKSPHCMCCKVQLGAIDNSSACAFYSQARYGGYTVYHRDERAVSLNVAELGL